jgi:hypothetical protein
MPADFPFMPAKLPFMSARLSFMSAKLSWAQESFAGLSGQPGGQFSPKKGLHDHRRNSLRRRRFQSFFARLVMLNGRF